MIYYMDTDLHRFSSDEFLIELERRSGLKVFHYSRYDNYSIEKISVDNRVNVFHHDRDFETTFTKRRFDIDLRINGFVFKLCFGGKNISFYDIKLEQDKYSMLWGDRYYGFIHAVLDKEKELKSNSKQFLSLLKEYLVPIFHSKNVICFADSLSDRHEILENVLLEERKGIDDVLKKNMELDISCEIFDLNKAFSFTQEEYMDDDFEPIFLFDLNEDFESPTCILNKTW